MYSSLEAAVAAGEPDGPDPGGDPASPLVGRGIGPGPVSLDEAVLRQLVAALADGIVLADEDGWIMLANRRAAAMFGYQPGELAGQLVESLMPAGLREAHRWTGLPMRSAGPGRWPTGPGWSDCARTAAPSR